MSRSRCLIHGAARVLPGSPESTRKRLGHGLSARPGGGAHSRSGQVRRREKALGEAAGGPSMSGRTHSRVFPIGSQILPGTGFRSSRPDLHPPTRPVGRISRSHDGNRPTVTSGTDSQVPWVGFRPRTGFTTRWRCPTPVRMVPVGRISSCCDGIRPTAGGNRTGERGSEGTLGPVDSMAELASWFRAVPQVCDLWRSQTCGTGTRSHGQEPIEMLFVGAICRQAASRMTTNPESGSRHQPSAGRGPSSRERVRARGLQPCAAGRQRGGEGACLSYVPEPSSDRRRSACGWFLPGLGPSGRLNADRWQKPMPEQTAAMIRGRSTILVSDQAIISK